MDKQRLIENLEKFDLTDLQLIEIDKIIAEELPDYELDFNLVLE